MRVALAYRNFNLRGSLERDVVFLARALAARGVDVHVYCNPDTRTADAAGVSFHDVCPAAGAQISDTVERASFAQAATAGLRRDRDRYDLVDVTSTAAWEHDIVRVGCVAHARGLTRTIQRRQFRPGAYARVIAATEEVRDDLMSAHRVPPDAVDVVPPPVGIEQFVRANGPARRSLGLPAEAPVLLYVGHDSERTDLEEAIAALALLDSPAHLVVVGGGEARPYRQRAEAAGVAGRVHFVGATEAPESYFRDADLLLLPTRHDPWGAALVEAVAAGLPVVTTAALVADPASGGRMGRAGRFHAESDALDRHVDAILAIYERALAERGRSRRAGAADTRVACLPSVSRMNPYHRLLYGELGRLGIEVEADARFQLAWLRRARGRVGTLHFHWPESCYRYAAGPRAARGALSWVKLGLFALRLAAARRLGYRIVWTVHQVYPHDRRSRRRDRIAARLLARASAVLVAHDRPTRELALRELGASLDVRIVPHGSYVGVYPRRRRREEVRAELGVPDGAFAFLAFGELRTAKEVGLALEAFAAWPEQDACLVVAGLPRDPATVRALEEAAAADPRIRLVLRYVPDDEVADLFAACDAALLPRGDGGTSGSLVLALSLGCPVVAADCPAYAELTGGEAAGWLFRPGDAASLRDALARAASAPVAARRKGRNALDRASELRWPAIAEATAALLRSGAAP